MSLNQFISGRSGKQQRVAVTVHLILTGLKKHFTDCFPDGMLGMINADLFSDDFKVLCQSRTFYLHLSIQCIYLGIGYLNNENQMLRMRVTY